MTQQTGSGVGGIGEGYLFGVPVKDFGILATLLISLALGFVVFFAGTFCGIVWIMVASSAGQQGLDYAWSYSRVGLPLGVLSAVVSLGYLGWLWVKRQVERR